MLDDITPPHHPSAIIREAKERAKTAKAIAVVIVNEDDSMWYDACGHEKQSVLWALMKMQQEVLDDE